MQRNLGIPLPAGTQWEIVQQTAKRIEPVYEELTRLAAQGQVIHNDDTTMKILELMPKRSAGDTSVDKEGSENKSERTGLFTTGIVSIAFVDLLTQFPVECRRVIEVFRKVYVNDTLAKE